jgi:hypothetical protein
MSGEPIGRENRGLKTVARSTYATKSDLTVRGILGSMFGMGNPKALTFQLFRQLLF